MVQRRNDTGETLVEIIITIALVTIAVTALITSLGTVSANANSHRNDVLADTILRNYAEATKLAVQQQCQVISSGLVAYPPNQKYTVSAPTLPSGFSVLPLPGSPTTCPARSNLLGTQLPSIALAVTGPGGLSRNLYTKVRTP